MLPFLQVLGFDIYDPTEVKPEYIADFAKKKSGGQFERLTTRSHSRESPQSLLSARRSMLLSKITTVSSRATSTRRPR